MKRRSTSTAPSGKYKDESLKPLQVSQLLWAAQGVTHPDGYHTVSPAGALYPLEVYLLAGVVEDLNQEMILDAPASYTTSAIYERSTVKYRGRGIQYVHMDVGSVAQNIDLQAESLELGTVFIGAFHNVEVKAAMNLQRQERPSAILPIGRKYIYPLRCT